MLKQTNPIDISLSGLSQHVRGGHTFGDFTDGKLVASRRFTSSHWRWSGCLHRDGLDHFAHPWTRKGSRRLVGKVGDDV
jgi:hypothetical protein